MIIPKFLDPDFCERAKIQARADSELHELVKNRLHSYLQNLESDEVEQAGPFSEELVRDLLSMMERLILLENCRIKHLERETYEFEREVGEKESDSLSRNWYRDSVAELMLLMSKVEVRDTLAKSKHGQRHNKSRDSQTGPRAD